jgi:hypothetical protein
MAKSFAFGQGLPSAIITKSEDPLVGSKLPTNGSKDPTEALGASEVSCYLVRNYVSHQMQAKLATRRYFSC